MTYGTIFSGIGGWELGLNAAGWDLKWQCEREPYCRAVLRERFGVPICPDVGGLCPWLKRNVADYSVDAVIGSPPCQPFSVAGAQRGTDDERHLYPAFIRAVRQLRPRIVLMEQVPAILTMDGGRAFGGYVGGLVALGYDCVWHCIPASAVGADHERDRLWVIAHALRSRLPKRSQAWAHGEDAGKLFKGLGFAVLDAKTLSYNDGRVEPVMGGTVYGVSRRPHRLKGLGNAVVPQIPFLIAEAINRAFFEANP